mgnify:FL=1
MSYYIPTWSPPGPPEEYEGERCPDCGGCSRYLRDTDNTGDFELYECDECGRQFERYNPIPF